MRPFSAGPCGGLFARKSPASPSPPPANGAELRRNDRPRLAAAYETACAVRSLPVTKLVACSAALRSEGAVEPLRSKIRIPSPDIAVPLQTGSLFGGSRWCAAMQAAEDESSACRDELRHSVLFSRRSARMRTVGEMFVAEFDYLCSRTGAVRSDGMRSVGRIRATSGRPVGG